MDQTLAELFDGEYIGANDGTQLDGGIVDDALWQDNYRRIIVYLLSQYDISGSSVGRLFIKLHADEIDGVRERKWNMEKVLCFMSTILHTSSDVKGSSNIWRRVRQRLLDWENKKYWMLISSTVLCTEVQINRKRGVLPSKRERTYFRHSFAGVKREQRSSMKVNGRKVEY